MKQAPLLLGSNGITMNNQLIESPLEFVITKEYRRFVEFCEACRRDRYIGLCYGPPGVGKTLSARHYTQWDLIEEARRHYLQDEAPPAEALSCRTLFYTPAVANNPLRIERDLRELNYWLNDTIHVLTMLKEGKEDYSAIPYRGPDYADLIIVDEADRLKMAGLEQLRDNYDRGKLGLVLIGMPGIEKRLGRYAQLYSRVGFTHQFRALSEEELHYLLEKKWEQLGLRLNRADFTDAEAITTIIRITGGNFRLLQRLFAQIERILQINQLQTVTKEVVEAARESLVIGQR